MSSHEQPNQKREYDIRDFYFEMSKLQLESKNTGQDKEYFDHINLDDLDESDMELYQIVKQEIQRIGSFHRSRSEDFKQFSPASTLPKFGPNVKDLLKERFSEVAVNGKLSQRIFEQYLSHKFGEVWGLTGELPSQDDFEKGPKDF